MEAAITTKGQATIPKAIRDHLGLKSGGRVKFFIHPDGSVVLLPIRPISTLKGALRRAPNSASVTIDDMSEASIAGAAEAYVRGAE